MPKSSNKQIKEDKKKIIQQIKMDARKSPHEIAKELGFSRQKVWRMIKELENENILWGYTGIVDDEFYDRAVYLALSKFKSPIFDAIDQIIKSVKEDTESLYNIEIHTSCYLNGNYDWILIFSSKDTREAKKFCHRIEKEYQDYIERIELMECIFPLIKFGRLNPDIERLKEFEII